MTGPSSSKYDATLHSHSSLSHRGPALDAYRTYSMTQSSYITHSLAHRRPYVHAAHYQVHVPLQTFRSQSPFAYPTRLKRPGYRPSSPALSLNKSVPSNDPDRGQTPRTASPASLHTVSEIPTPWHQYSNRSESLLRYHPPMQGAPSSRESTPKPPSSLHSASSARLSQAQATNTGMWSDSTALTVPPLFYDYSEGFEQQIHIHRTSLLVIIPSLQKGEEDKNEYVEHHQVPELEQPNYRSTEEGPPLVAELEAYGSSDNLSVPGTRQWPEQPVYETVTATTNTPTPTGSETPKQVLTNPTDDEATEDANTGIVDVSLPLETEQQSDRKAETKEIEAPVGEEEQPSGHEHMIEPESSSPAASMYSVQSSIPLDNVDGSTAPTTRADVITASPDLAPRTPICDTPINGFPLPRGFGHMSEGSKASISIKSTRNDYPDIVAPTPERSIASLSNRDRFSKILGLDEALLELDSLTALSTRRVTRDSHAASPTLKARVRPQEDLSALAMIDHTITEEPNHDNDNEWTNGSSNLLRQPDKNSRPDSVIESPHSSSLIDGRGSSVPSSSGVPTSTNIRLSHRKTVINGGQKIEAKPETTDHGSLSFDGRDLMSIPAIPPTEEEPADPVNHSPAINNFSPPFKVFAPPKNISQSDLPCAFTPLIRPPSENVPVAELDATTSFYVRKQSRLSSGGQSPRLESWYRPERASTISPGSSRPWNLDANYTWSAEESPQLDIVSPLPRKKSRQSTEKPPKFRLRIHRASTSTASRLTKKHRSSEDTLSSVIASSADFLKAASHSQKQKPKLSIAPGQNNSSHDIIRASPMQTRFVESFEQPSPTSPTITLMPPSPGHDVRSFFSDDSSQARPKGSLRKRLSDLRARSSRANSIDPVTGYDRGLLNSALGLSRASGRSSRQSQATTGGASYSSQTRRSQWSIFSSIRAWLSRHTRRFHHPGRRSRYKPDSASRSGI